jgi:hypothetical protein
MFHRHPLRLVLLASVLAVVAACGGGTPAAPALTDPGEILTKSLASLKDVKTVEMTGTLSGTIPAEGLGDIDLSSARLEAAADIATGHARIKFSMPTLLGTEVEAIIVEDAAYLKASGAAAMLLGGASDKWLKSDIPESADKPVNDPGEIDKQIDDFGAQIGDLPSPTKEANEKCGDADCYHVKIAMTAEELAKLSPEASAVGDGSFTLDLWSRTSDLRPAKITLSGTSTETGTIGITLEFRYDGTVSIEAPPADQVQS